MNMQEFYKNYNLNRTYFAEIAGVGTRTLSEYANGKPIRDDSKDRIERAIRVITENNLVRPVYHGRPGDFISYEIFRKDNWNYIKRSKELIKKERLT